MRRRIHTHQQNTRIPTPEPSTAPAQGMFQPRPFGEPSPTADVYQQPDLKTSLIQAERYGHHLSQMHDTDVSPPQVTQPKMGMGRSMQSEPAAQLAPKPVQPSSGGRSLPKNVQQKMEAAFSSDFSNITVHEGAQAEAMGADACAQGNQIHFQPGRYNPTSQAGQQLLGHELTHVVQQRAGQVAAPQGKGTAINSDPKLEQEADTLGAKAAQGEQVQVAGVGSGIQRQASSQLGHNFASAVQLKGGGKKKRPQSSSSRSSSPAPASRSSSPAPASRSSSPAPASSSASSSDTGGVQLPASRTSSSASSSDTGGVQLPASRTSSPASSSDTGGVALADSRASSPAHQAPAKGTVSHGTNGQGESASKPAADLSKGKDPIPPERFPKELTAQKEDQAHDAMTGRRDSNSIPKLGMHTTLASNLEKPDGTGIRQIGLDPNQGGKEAGASELASSEIRDDLKKESEGKVHISDRPAKIGAYSNLIKESNTNANQPEVPRALLGVETEDPSKWQKDPKDPGSYRTTEKVGTNRITEADPNLLEGFEKDMGQTNLPETYQNLHNKKLPRGGERERTPAELDRIQRAYPYEPERRKKGNLKK